MIGVQNWRVGPSKAVSKWTSDMGNSHGLLKKLKVGQKIIYETNNTPSKRAHFELLNATFLKFGPSELKFTVCLMRTSWGGGGGDRGEKLKSDNLWVIHHLKELTLSQIGFKLPLAECNIIVESTLLPHLIPPGEPQHC